VLSRYTDVNSIIEYIKIQKIEEDIIQGNIHNIASNFVSLNFSKKLGAIKKKNNRYITKSSSQKLFSIHNNFQTHKPYTDTK